MSIQVGLTEMTFRQMVINRYITVDIYSKNSIVFSLVYRYKLQLSFCWASGLFEIWKKALKKPTHLKYCVRCVLRIPSMEVESSVWKEGNVLFNDALNTIYLRLYGKGPLR